MSTNPPASRARLTLKASPYSYFAIVYLRRNRQLLKQYDVEVEYVSQYLLHPSPALNLEPPYPHPQLHPPL